MGKIINNDVLCGKYVNLRQAEEKDGAGDLPAPGDGQGHCRGHAGGPKPQ